MQSSRLPPYPNLASATTKGCRRPMIPLLAGGRPNRSVRHGFTWIAGMLTLLAAGGLPAPAEQTPPKVTKQSKPIYPFGMRRSDITGDVMVGFVVDKEGRVTVAHVLKSSHPGFRQAAIDAVENWRFEPAIVNGKPVNARMQVPIYFRIDGRPENSGWAVKRPKAFPADLPAELQWDKPPRVISYSPPVFPRAAVLEKRRGTVSVQFVVGPDGEVLTAKTEGEEHPDMNRAAIAAVQTFKFDPPRKADGTACGAVLNLDFDFFLSTERGDAPYTHETRRVAKLLADTASPLPSLKDLDEIPKAVAQRPPTIPPKLRQSPQPAEAMIEFVINRHGLVQLPRIMKTTDEEFGYAAVQAVADWGFMPPQIDGKPVDVVALIPVAFNPPGSEATTADKSD